MAGERTGPVGAGRSLEASRLAVRRVWRSIAAGAAAMALAGLAGCDQSDGEDVASLPSPSPPGAGASAPPAEPAPTEIQPAEAMAACLSEGGAPAVAVTREDGQLEVRMDTDESYVGCFADGGACLASVSEDTKSAGLPNPPAGKESGDWLVVGGVDHSEAFAACAAETGYRPPVWLFERDEELRQKEAIVEATLTWTRCAREQGLSVRDPEPPVADSWQTRPAALIDPAASAAELRATLAVCPNFDTEAHTADAAAQRQEDHDPSQAVVDPEIYVDAPGWRDGVIPEPGSPEWTAQLAALWDEITAANRAFWQSQGGLG
ncbi:MAG: hypothetical protein LBD77_06855 [Bifidobacteriaceae bacterium]|nr:hypothetical protein [Bifidobacteriaceae bacterium]